MTNYVDFNRYEINFEGKVAVVTGAGAGLGKSYAIELSKRGAKVVVNDIASVSKSSIKSNLADKVVSKIKNEGGHAIPSYDDITSISGGLKLIQKAVDYFGTVDILINNAGILCDRSFVKMSFSEWNDVLAVHLNGVYNTTSPAFKIMKDNRSGRIIMTTSASGLYGNFGQVNYAAAKMAIIGMMNSLKLEGKKYNINVNTIAPIARSKLTKEILPPDFLTKANPELVASLVLYLCSDNCNTTGGLYNVGMGYISKAAIFTEPWIKIQEFRDNCSPEKIFKKWHLINKIQKGREVKNIEEIFLDLLKEKQ